MKPGPRTPLTSLPPNRMDFQADLTIARWTVNILISAALSSSVKQWKRSVMGTRRFGPATGAGTVCPVGWSGEPVDMGAGQRGGAGGMDSGGTGTGPARMALDGLDVPGKLAAGRRRE